MASNAARAASRRPFQATTTLLPTPECTPSFGTSSHRSAGRDGETVPYIEADRDGQPPIALGSDDEIGCACVPDDGFGDGRGARVLLAPFEGQRLPFERRLESGLHRRVIAPIDLGALVKRQGIGSAGHPGGNHQEWRRDRQAHDMRLGSLRQFDGSADNSAYALLVVAVNKYGLVGHRLPRGTEDRGLAAR
jgi:hypothetical protein